MERGAEIVGADIGQREQQEIQRAVQTADVIGPVVPVLYVEMDGYGCADSEERNAGTQGEERGATRPYPIFFTPINIFGTWRASFILTMKPVSNLGSVTTKIICSMREKLRNWLRHCNPYKLPTQDLAEKICTETEYFANNAERMRYPEFRKQHLFVGSGVVEAGCKTVIGSRLNSPECSGPSRAPTPSWPCDAAISMAALKTIGIHATRLELHFHVAHPM